MFSLVFQDTSWFSHTALIPKFQIESNPFTDCTNGNPTPSGEYVIEPEIVDQTSYRLVSRKLLNGDLGEDDSTISGETVHLDNVICYTPSMTNSNLVLLLGKNDDEEIRLLIAPREGRALEIRPLSISFNEAKRRLEIEWEKRRALGDEDTRGAGK